MRKATTQLALLQNIGLTELLINTLIVLLLFGSTQIPKLMCNLGSGISQFKKGLGEGKGDGSSVGQRADRT